jgi:MFS transporter, FSR family, fosmidomycin resistance protein
MTETAVKADTSRDLRVITCVSTAHFVSHFYMLVLPPLFAFVRDDYGATYTELALAIAAFNVVSAAFQTPAGFLVDRLGPNAILIGGLLLGAFGFAVAAAVHSYWVLVAMFAILGLGNTTYHPADYAILSEQVSQQGMGRAYSIHTFAGMLGTAVAPASMLVLQDAIGWRGAFYVAAALGIVVAGFVAILSTTAQRTPHRAPTAAARTDVGWPLLLSPPIIRNLAFFALLAVISGGIQNYFVVALAALYGTPLEIGNGALTAYLLVTTIGILIGGVLVGRTSSVLVATLGVLFTGLCLLLVGAVNLGTVLLILIMSIAGFATGVAMPSRDMIVREVTPPGSFGKVFGFVSTGFNIAGVIAPLAFGAMMDHGNPRAVLLVVAGSCILAIATVVTGGEMASGRRATAVLERLRALSIAAKSQVHEATEYIKLALARHF